MNRTALTPIASQHVAIQSLMRGHLSRVNQKKQQHRTKNVYEFIFA
jgi:hypothetical protein